MEDSNVQGGRGERDGRASQEVPPWYAEHSPLTVEGSIEARGQFIRGAVRARGWRRVVVMLMLLLFVLPVGVALVAQVVQILRSMF